MAAMRCGLSLIFFLSCICLAYSETCARKTCIEGAFKFAPGKTYKYSYSTIAKFGDGTPEAFTMNIEARMTFLSACNVQLHTVLVSVSQESQVLPANIVQDLKTGLEKNVVNFGFYNGKIGEVCWESEESATVLNVKKGILSAFQVAATTSTGFTKGTFLEVNLAGECPTIYTLNNGEDNLLYLNRTWSASKCSKGTPVSPAQTFGLGQVFQSRLNSEPSCQHLITDGIIKSASCVERHSLKSFDKKSAPMTIRVVQHLIFLEVTETATAEQALTNPITGTLRFELKAVAPTFLDSTTPLELFDWFCQSSKDEVKTETPMLFKSLVRKLRTTTNCKAMEATYRDLAAPTSCMSMSADKKNRLVLDAMTAVNSPCSVEVVSKLIATDEIEITDADLWFSSLAFVQPITSEMLRSLSAILSRRDLPRAGFLGISTLTHNYCLYDSECDTGLVSDIAMSILTKLNPECQTMVEDVDTMVTYLKALGNIGPITRKIEDVLLLIAQCKVKALPIRIAAVDALRFRTCDAGEFSQVQTTLLSILGDSTEDTELRAIVFQMLMNCPDQEVIRRSIEMINGQTAEMQLRTFMASFIKNLNETTATNNAATIAQTLLSSYKITVPKANLWSSKNVKYTIGNLTGSTPAMVDGNLLFVDSYLPRSADLGLSVELFGQQVKLFQAGARMEYFEEVIERLMASVYRKSTKDQIKIVEDSAQSQERMIEDPNFSTYLRIFGSDVAFFTYGDLRNAAADYISQQIGALDYFFGRQKSTPFEISRNIMLIDGIYQVPTTSGLPITLQVSATASGKIAGQTRLNIGGFFKPEAPVAIEGTISPSFAIEIEATFSVNVDKITTGFKTVTTVHSSTSLQGSVEYKNRQYVRSSLTLPQDRQTIFTFQTRSYAIRGTEQKMILANPATSKRVLQHTCTDRLTQRILGVTLCAQIGSEDPINGGLRDGLLPAHFRVWLHKTDPKLTSYNFELGFPQSDKWEFNALLDTPGSTINRKFQAMYKFDDEGKIKGALATPWKQYDVNGQFRMSPNELRLDVLEDKTRPYRLLINEAPSSGQEKNVRAQLEYRSVRSGRNQEVLLSHSTRKFVTATNLLKRLSTLSVEFTEYPQMNKLVQMEVLRSPESLRKHLETTWNIYGPDFRNEEQKIFFHTFLSTKQIGERYNLTTAMKLRVPRSSDVTPMEAEMAYTQEWDKPYKFFDGRLETKSMFGEKSARLAWDNLWSTKKSLTVKADVIGLPKTASIKAIVKDASIDRQRSYPFEVEVNMADEKPMKVAGEFTGGKNDASITMDVLRDDQPYITTSHTFQYPALMINSQYQMQDQNGRLEATKVSPFDWTVKGNWVKGNDQWNSVVGLIPSGSNGVNAVVVLTKYTPSDYITRKYGFDVGFKTAGQVQPVDIRTSVTVFTGTSSHAYRHAVQLSLKPTEKRFVSLSDLTIDSESPNSRMLGMELEGLMSDLKALASLKFLHNLTIPVVPKFISTSGSMEMGGWEKPHVYRFAFTKDAEKGISALESVVNFGFYHLPGGRKDMNVSGVINGTLIAKNQATDDITFHMFKTTKLKNRQASLNLKTPYRTIKSGKIEVNVDETSDTLQKKQVRVLKNDILMLDAEALVTNTKTPVAELASANWTVKMPQMSDKITRVMLKKTMDKLNEMSSYKIDVYPGEETTATFSGMLTMNNSSNDFTLYVPKKTVKGKFVRGTKKGLFRDFSVDVAWDALRNAAKHIKVSHKAPEVAVDDLSGWSVEHPLVPESMASISFGQVPQRVVDIVKYSKDELHDVLTSFKVDEATHVASHAFDGSSFWSTPVETEPVLERIRRNAIALAMAGGGGCGGSNAMAMAGSGGSCGGYSSNNFGAIASSIQSQLSQVMQDMVSKFQQHASQPAGQSQTQAMYLTGGMQASYPAPSPCGSGYVQQSSGCVSAQAPQQQTHKIQIQLGQPQVSYSAPAPTYQVRQAQYPAPSYQAPAPSYQAPAPSYQQAQAQSQAIYPSHSVSQDSQPSYSPVDAYQSPYYQAQPSQGVPQYAAPQKTAPSGPSQSYSVPIGNGHLTIQIHTSGTQAQPAAPAPPACSPGSSSPGCPGAMQYMASGSSSNQYAASASNQNQYAMSGQLPYGGGAEPRLQYCTPGSTEKGVCLNGVDSLEPTRTKRSTEMIQDMSNGIADYAKVAKKAVSDVWDSVTAQPEVQYLMDVSRRITKDNAIEKVGNDALDTLTTYVSDAMDKVKMDQILDYASYFWTSAQDE